MRVLVSCFTVVALALSASAAAAQSLGDLARQEEARRKAIAASGKVYTNDSLDTQRAPDAPITTAQPAAPTTAPAAPPPSTSPAVPGAGSTPPAPSASNAPKTEAEWRKRVADERNALSRAQIFAEALQTRINALSTDFVNTDDPAKREVVAADRQKSLAELDRVKQEIQQHQKAITDLQDEARRAGVPAGWVR
jgi:hypothetical protein